MQTIEILKEPVDLFRLLKFEGLASSGGEAKQIVSAGLVTVNGAIETRMRKKIISGDIIGFAGQEFRVAAPDPQPGADTP